MQNLHIINVVMGNFFHVQQYCFSLFVCAASHSLFIFFGSLVFLLQKKTHSDTEVIIPWLTAVNDEKVIPSSSYLLLFLFSYKIIKKSVRKSHKVPKLFTFPFKSLWKHRCVCVSIQKNLIHFVFCVLEIEWKRGEKRTATDWLHWMNEWSKKMRNETKKSSEHERCE